jgi:ATP-dependent helicase/nuclease subunit A
VGKRAGGFVVIHKSFPGTIELEGERLLAFAGQAGLYAHALERVTGGRAENIGCISR